MASSVVLSGPLENFEAFSPKTVIAGSSDDIITEIIEELDLEVIENLPAGQQIDIIDLEEENIDLIPLKQKEELTRRSCQVMPSDPLEKAIQMAEIPEGNNGEVILASLTGFKKSGYGPEYQDDQEYRWTNLDHGLPPMSAGTHSNLKKPYVKITEQPASNKMRFRYKCEGRGAGSLLGVSTSTAGEKTYPTIKIVGYTGPAVIVVSCVEEEGPAHKCHPHRLVGKQCTKGIGRLEIDQSDMTAVFSNLGVQCAKRTEAAESLAQRKGINVDPFRQGFEHSEKNINLNAIRLCFQAFLTMPGRAPIGLDPVVSEVIRDRKAYGDLVIVNFSDNVASVEGGKKILLFCEKVTKDEIEVHFSYKNKDGVTQVQRGVINMVHKQFGIALQTPALTNFANITEQVHAQMYLYTKKNDIEYKSDGVDFYFVPMEMKRPTVLAQKSQAKKHKRPESLTSDSALSSTWKPTHPPKFKDSGSNVIIEKRQQSKTSFTEKCLMAEDLSTILVDFIPEKQTDSASRLSSRKESMTQDISNDLSSMKIKTEKQSPVLETPDVSMSQKSSSKIKTEKSSLLETPDVSSIGHQSTRSTRSSSSKINNLDLLDVRQCM